QMTVKNAPGAALNLTPSWGFINGFIFIADGATVTANTTDMAKGGASFIDNVVFYSTHSGSWDLAKNHVDWTGFRSGPRVPGNAQIPLRGGFDVGGLNDPGKAAFNSGAFPEGNTYNPHSPDDAFTIDEQNGVRNERLVRAERNIGVQ